MSTPKRWTNPIVRKRCGVKGRLRDSAALRVLTSTLRLAP